MAKRRLEDLWVRGGFVDFDDGKGDPVKVWVQKLSPVEVNLALRRANAARARIKTVKYHPESDAYMEMWLEVLEWETKDELVTYLLATAEGNIEDRVEAEMAAEDEWSNEGYLQGLRDSWEGGLKDAYIVDPEGPDGVEASRVLAELTRFAAAVRERAAPEVEAAKAHLESQDIEDLQDQAMERVIRYRGNAAWLNEMRLCEIFYGTHDAVPDAKQPGKWVASRDRYWTSRADFDGLPNEVLTPLLAKYAELNVDVLEGKGSEGTPTSSPSSGPPPEPATEASSGLVAVGQ
jgi:hypothetical protein